MSKTEYEALNDRDKARYNKTFTKSKHGRVEGAGRKRKVKDSIVSTLESPRAGAKRRGVRDKEVSKQVKLLHEEGAGVVNKESVQALALIRPEHLHKGAINIQNNRDEIHKLIEHQFSGKEEALSSGLSAIRDLMTGEGHGPSGPSGPDGPEGPDDDDDDILEGEFTEIDDDEISDDDAEDGAADEDEAPKKSKKTKKKSIVGTILASGRVVDDELIAEYTKNKGKIKSKFGDRKPAVDEDGDPIHDEDGNPMTVGDVRAHEYDEVREHLGKNSKFKNRNKGKHHGKQANRGNSILHTLVKTSLLAAGVGLLALGAGPLALIASRGLVELWDSFGPMAAHASATPEDDLATINEVITQTSMYLKNMRMDDLHDNTKTMMKAIAASPKVDLYRVVFDACVPLNTGRKPAGYVGRNFHGTTKASNEQLVGVITQSLKENNVPFKFERDDGHIDEASIFHCGDRNRTTIVLGTMEQHNLYHVSFVSEVSRV